MGFGGILVIFRFWGVFWSFFEFWGYFGHLKGFAGCFAHFKDFGSILVILVVFKHI